MTFTILASDPERRLLGAATASYSLAVGAGVPLLRPGVGAVASQAYTNRSLRQSSLDALANGATPDQVIAELPSRDPGYSQRQLALIAADGSTAVHTGTDCSQWAGSVLGTNLVAAGNLLAGPDVLAAMRAAFDRARSTYALTHDALSDDDHTAAFARALVEALAAGEAAGGDSRGKQSAALLVASGAGIPQETHHIAIDLRADDHPEPVTELSRLLERALGK